MFTSLTVSKNRWQFKQYGQQSPKEFFFYPSVNSIPLSHTYTRFKRSRCVSFSTQLHTRASEKLGKAIQMESTHTVILICTWERERCTDRETKFTQILTNSDRLQSGARETEKRIFMNCTGRRETKLDFKKRVVYGLAEHQEGKIGYWKTLTATGTRELRRNEHGKRNQWKQCRGEKVKL